MNTQINWLQNIHIPKSLKELTNSIVSLYMSVKSTDWVEFTLKNQSFAFEVSCEFLLSGSK